MKFLSLLITSCALSSLTFANQPIPSVFNIENGKIVQTAPTLQIDPNTIYTHLNAYLNLPNSYSFRIIKDEIDQLGMRHIAAEQYFQGVKIDGGIILTHFKGNELRSVQGMMANFESFNIKASYPSEKASKQVLSFLQLKKVIHTEPVELIIYMDMDHASNPYQLMYQVRMDGINQEGVFTAQTVLINAQDGSIFTTLPHTYHGDVTHTAHTYLYGTRNITVDSLGANSFELRDNGRNIETYHTAGSEYGGWSNLFPTARIFSNNNDVWDSKLAINTVKVIAIDSTMSANRTDSNKLFFQILDFNNTPISWITSTNGPNYSIRNLFSFYQPNTANSIVVGLEHVSTGDTTFTHTIPLQNNTVGTHTFSSANDSIRGEYTIQDVKNPGLDIHWGMAKTHDFYLDKFNRNSFDNRGGLVKNYFDGVYPLYTSQSNAAALGNPYNVMVYGNGTTIPYVALDVCGHEFTHLVVNENGTGGLRYQGESGALNESFADIMGTAIEFYSLGDSVANYLIGEDVMGGNSFMRSMENPNSKNFPDTYKGRYWISTTNNYDNGGVHFNSSVQNHWFYLLCEGGEGTNDNDYKYNHRLLVFDSILFCFKRYNFGGQYVYIFVVGNVHV